MLPFLGPHLDDTNKDIANAVPWVLREMSYRYADEVVSYVAEPWATCQSPAEKTGHMRDGHPIVNKRRLTGAEYR